MTIINKFQSILIVCLLQSIFGRAQSDSSYLYADSSFYKIWKLSINSTTDDFSPIIYKNGIAFTSDRENEFGVVYIEKGTKKHLLDVFFTTQLDSFNFSPPVDFSRKINSTYHDGPVCFSADEKTILFTTNGRKEQKKVLMIYESQFIDGEWTEPEPINLNDPEYSIAHPALSYDGQTLFFASDMPGGFGASDIYVSTKDLNNQWSKPINLGPEINTKASDNYPFIDPNGILYFSSAGHGGFGKLDIYSAVKISSGHYEVKNLGYPINSKGDDFGFTCDSLYSRGFFSSARNGIHDNIYGFYSSMPKFCNCDTAKTAELCYTFFEERSLSEKDTTGTTYQWDFGDGTKAIGNSVDHCFDSPGKYTINLNIIDNSTGMLFYTQSSYEMDLEYSSALTLHVPDSIGVGDEVSVNGNGNNIPGYTIKNYYWKLNDKEYKRGIKTTLNYSSPGEQKVYLGVLAQDNKSKQIKEFCTTKSIVVVNEKNFTRKKHVRDSLASIRVVGNFVVHLGSAKNMNISNSHVFNTYNEVNLFYGKGVYRFSKVELKELIGSLPYSEKQHQSNYGAILNMFENDKPIPDPYGKLMGTILDSNSLKAFAVFFNQGESSLNGVRKLNLSDVIDLLAKNQKLKVDIIARNDGRGPSDYNQKLSRDRANSIKSYLVSQGCDSKRIKTFSVTEKPSVSEKLDDLSKRAYRRADIVLHE